MSELEKDQRPKAVRKAEFRFSVVGGLLSSPPGQGELKKELEKLAAKTWRHPISGKACRYDVPTIERWYYMAKREKKSPLDRLTPQTRLDRGSFKALTQEIAEKWKSLYDEHAHWSILLLYDNFAAWARSERIPPLEQIPSYSTLRRFSLQNGLFRKQKPRCREDGTPLESSINAIARKENFEVRSFEAPYVGSLWHLDFHTGSRAILLENAEWAYPELLVVMDDTSRLACHGQWYLTEATETLVHGFCQSVQKRGRPRGLMSDRGAAMMSEEFTQGLLRLSIMHEPTLEYSPYQNGKIERFWALVEGRLLPMLENVCPLTLNQLNDLTQTWIEGEYNQTLHSEIGCSPVSKFSHSKSVLQDSPSSQELRLAFVREITRRQRKTDGTVSIEGIRFEIPSAYRHHERILVQYPSWDLSQVYLVDQTTYKPIVRLLPVDKEKNAQGKRKANQARRPVRGETVKPQMLPPRMRQLLKLRDQASLPPAYLPHEPIDT